MKTMRSFKFSAVLILAAALPSGAYALGGDPAQVKILSQMYTQMKQQLKALQDELEEVKMVSDEVYKAREYLNALREEYEFVMSFDPQRELNSIMYWADGMTNLNDLSGKNWQQQWSLLSGEVNKRFEQSPAPEAVRESNKEDQMKDWSEIGQVESLEDFYRKQALANNDASMKDYQRQIASSTAMMTSIMLEERAEKLRAKAEKHERVMNGIAWDHEFTSYLEGGE